MKNSTGAFVKYVSANMLGMVGVSCYILADTFFVARALGSVGLAALNFSISLYSVMQGFGLLLGIGGATRFAVLRGRESGVGSSIFTHTLLLGGIFAAVFMAAGLFFSAPLSMLLGADGAALPLADVYLKTLLSFAPFFLANNILLAFVRNDGAPRLAMTAMLVSSFSNIVLDYVFMFPLSMGMFGAAFATALSPVISLCILALHFLKKKNSFRLCRCRIELRQLYSVLPPGFSSLVTELASAVALITFNLIILGVAGTVGVAAYGVVANIALVAVSVFTGIAQGLQPLASSSYGKGELSSARHVLRLALFTGLILAALFWVLLWCFGDRAVALFNSEGNAALAEIAGQGLLLYFPGFLFAGVNMIAAAYLSATCRAGRALLIALLRSCVVMVPMVLLLSAVLGMTGIWLSFVATEFTVFFLSLLSLRREAGQKRA